MQGLGGGGAYKMQEKKEINACGKTYPKAQAAYSPDAAPSQQTSQINLLRQPNVSSSPALNASKRKVGAVLLLASEIKEIIDLVVEYQKRSDRQSPGRLTLISALNCRLALQTRQSRPPTDSSRGGVVESSRFRSEPFCETDSVWGSTPNDSGLKSLASGKKKKNSRRERELVQTRRIPSGRGTDPARGHGCRRLNERGQAKDHLATGGIRKLRETSKVLINIFRFLCSIIASSHGLPNWAGGRHFAESSFGDSRLGILSLHAFGNQGRMRCARVHVCPATRVQRVCMSRQPLLLWAGWKR